MSNQGGILRVVLLCKGKGADKDSYRPRSDESQWWGRRDALVRCVASFLFGPKSNQGAPTDSRRELVFLFDEDFARLHMTVDTETIDASENAFPKEQTVIQLWKRASQNLRKPVVYGGMRCILHLDPILSLNPSSSSQQPASISREQSRKTGIHGIDTKRAVLEYIQKHVTVDFLREHKINSHPDVVLRKTNRKTLLKIWDAWNEHQQEDSSLKEKDLESGTKNSHQLTTIYNDLLKFPSNDTRCVTESSMQVVAGTLHETCDEFPCFGFNRKVENHSELSSSSRYHVCLFLGAVRDMTNEEKTILQRCCNTSKIPLVGVRFGTVPEFTSKILSLLAFHHANQVLDISLTRLLRNSKTTTGGEGPESIPKYQSTSLAIVCIVPKASKDVTIDIEKRDQTHWRLVRIIVCSLWRSKLVSSNSQVTHTNTLRLIFDDGVVVCLKERDFVGKLASQHQAAPSEFQILKALLEEISRQSKLQLPPPTSKKSSKEINHIDDKSTWSRKKLAKRLLKEVVASSPMPISCVIGVNSVSSNDIVSHFYNLSTRNERAVPSTEDVDYSVLMLMDITPFPRDSKVTTLGRHRKKRTTERVGMFNEPCINNFSRRPKNSQSRQSSKNSSPGIVGTTKQHLSSLCSTCAIRTEYLLEKAVSLSFLEKNESIQTKLMLKITIILTTWPIIVVTNPTIIS